MLFLFTRRFLSIIVIFLSFKNCKTLESFINPIYISAGLESASIRFVSDDKKTGPEAFNRQFSPDLIRSPFTGLRRILSQSARDTGFYTLRSSPIVISHNHWLGRYFAYSFSLDSPRIFRGELFDYPEKAVVPTTLEEQILFSFIPKNELTSRRMDFIYEELRLYGTGYIGYFNKEGFSLGLGLNYGQIRYNLTLLENNFRVSEVLGMYRPMLSTTIFFSYDIGHYFPNTILENVGIYIEAIYESNLRYPLKTQVLKSDGTNPPSLFLESNFVRVGFIKEINLIPTSEKE